MLDARPYSDVGSLHLSQFTGVTIPQPCRRHTDRIPWARAVLAVPWWRDVSGCGFNFQQISYTCYYVLQVLQDW